MTASTDHASPLGGWSSRFAANSAASGNFSIREVPFSTQINLRGNLADPDFKAKIRSVLGCDLPALANTWSSGGDVAVLWLGPDEWLVVAPDRRNEMQVEQLRAALGGLHHSVTDLSANRTVIEIAGSDARVVLAKGCPIDLHGSAFKPPQVAQTLLAKSQVILQCVEARPLFRLFVRLSFASYVSEWLLDAAAELAASRGIDPQRLANRLA